MAATGIRRRRLLGTAAATLAHLEGLDAHAAAVERRLAVLENPS